MSELHLQQLSGGEDKLQDNSAQLDQLVTEKSELSSKLEQVRLDIPDGIILSHKELN